VARQQRQKKATNSNEVAAILSQQSWQQ